MKKPAHYKVQIREPYMGNWIPLKIKLVWANGELQAIWVINGEGLAAKAEIEPDDDLFKRVHPDIPEDV
jgi:hypothetical protein